MSTIERLADALDLTKVPPINHRKQHFDVAVVDHLSLVSTRQNTITERRATRLASLQLTDDERLCRMLLPGKESSACIGQVQAVDTLTRTPLHRILNQDAEVVVVGFNGTEKATEVQQNEVLVYALI